MDQFEKAVKENCIVFLRPKEVKHMFNLNAGVHF